MAKYDHEKKLLMYFKSKNETEKVNIVNSRLLIMGKEIQEIKGQLDQMKK